MSGIRLRACALVVEDDRMLLVEHEKGGRRYHLLPGGGVELGETITDAVAREVCEETGLEVEVGRLLVVCEVIGEDGDGFRHVVMVVHEARVVGGSLRPGRDGRLVDCGWHPLDELERLTMHPPIATRLAEIVAAGEGARVVSLGNVRGA